MSCLYNFNTFFKLKTICQNSNSVIQLILTYLLKPEFILLFLLFKKICDDSTSYCINIDIFIVLKIKLLILCRAQCMNQAQNNARQYATCTTLVRPRLHTQLCAVNSLPLIVQCSNLDDPVKMLVPLEPQNLQVVRPMSG